MAQAAKATPEAIRAAIERLVVRGEKVTLQSVREEVGGGSLSTIQPLLQSWRKQQDEAARAQSAAAEPAGEDVPAVPLRVAQSLDAARAALDTIGGAVADAINIAVADERRRGRLELDTERETWERRLADALDARRAAEEDTAQLAADGAAIERDRDDLASRLAAADAETIRLAGALEGERAACRVARAEADQHAVAIQALNEAVEQAEARALAADQARSLAQEAQRAAEGRAQAADAECRAMAEQARLQKDQGSAMIADLTAARDGSLRDLAAERAAAASARSALEARIAALEMLVREQAARLEEALAAAAEARGRLAGETRRADDLASRLVKVEDRPAVPAARRSRHKSETP